MNSATARIWALTLLATLLILGGCDDSHVGITQAAGPGPPKAGLLTLRSDLLACTKTRLAAGDISLQPALYRLIRAAEAALAEPPVSVTHKKRVAPSGDPHDYASLAAQWWPDPNQPDGLPYRPRKGHRNPEAEDGEKYDRRRLELLISRVNALALAYYFTGRNEFAEHAVAYVRTWFIAPATRMTPHLKYANIIPGVDTGSALGIIEMRYLPSILDAIELLRAGGHWEAADQRAMEEWLSVYLDWVWGSSRGQSESAMPNNHGSWYGVQVAGVALFLDRTFLARQVIVSSAIRRIPELIETDGRQPEALRRGTSLFYSIFNLRALMQMAEMGRSVGVDVWGYEAPNGGSIRVALDFLAPYADPASRWPWPGTAYSTARNRMLEPLRIGELVYADSTYAHWIDRMPENVTGDHRVQLLYPAPSCSGVATSR